MIAESLYWALSFFGVYLVVILILLRLMKNSSAVTIVCLSALGVYAIALILSVLDIIAIHFISFSSAYWFFSVSLLMVFGAVLKSISLRMMMHLLDKPGRKQKLHCLLEHYIQNQSYTTRLDILLQKKLAKKVNNEFCLTQKGRIFALGVGVIQQLFSIKESG